MREYSTKKDPKLGLTLVREGRQWVPWASYFDNGGAYLVDDKGQTVRVPRSRDGYITLPNGKRTRNYYH